MKNTFSTERQLINGCPCGWELLSLAKSLNPPTYEWIFKDASRSLSDDNTYYAEFDIPQVPGCILELKYIIATPRETSTYKVVRKILPEEIQNV